MGGRAVRTLTPSIANERCEIAEYAIRSQWDSAGTLCHELNAVDFLPRFSILGLSLQFETQLAPESSSRPFSIPPAARIVRLA